MEVLLPITVIINTRLSYFLDYDDNLLNSFWTEVEVLGTPLFPADMIVTLSTIKAIIEDIT